ncbi:hypothetical protein OCHUTO_0274 [Orientia chuto str. Dubai]|uniref:Uncharacterized protein n=1 Tax=Orientia chuto str. Dubai TaxID=1359168 RepID=A0A0F3MMD0_9RICK|nr:hypothetical protein [Candidatus Orientia mediorientalis]KJV56900.1 hypothetical protein OCHUTO_0274 [Orientia chuto str. Dubai]
MKLSNRFYVFLLISFSCHLILSYVVILFASQQHKPNNKIINLELVQINKVSNKTTSNNKANKTTFQVKKNNLYKTNIKQPNIRSNSTNDSTVVSKKNTNSLPTVTPKVEEQTLKNNLIKQDSNTVSTIPSPVINNVTDTKSSSTEPKSSVTTTTNIKHSITQENNTNYNLSSTKTKITTQQHIAKNITNKQNASNIDSTNYTDAIKYQIQAHWNHTIGFIPGISTVLMINIALDGNIEKITDISCNCPDNNTTVCNLFVQNIKRAIWAASPFQELPKEEYNTWQQLVLEFSPEG